MKRISGTSRFLSNAVQTFGINTGSINGLVDAILNNLTIRGSLYNYTSNMGFRDDNLINNFSAGEYGRYGYNDNTFNSEYNVWDNISSSYPLEKTRIGMPYEKNDYGDSTIEFKSKEELDEIQSGHRSKNINKNRESYPIIEHTLWDTVTYGVAQDKLNVGDEYEVKKDDVGDRRANLTAKRRQYYNGYANLAIESGLFSASTTFRDSNLRSRIAYGKYGAYNFSIDGSSSPKYPSLIISGITSPGSTIKDEYYVKEGVEPIETFLDEDGDIYDRSEVNRNKAVSYSEQRGHSSYRTYVGSDVKPLALKEKFKLSEVVELGGISLSTDGLYNYGDYRKNSISANEYTYLSQYGFSYGKDAVKPDQYSVNIKNTFYSGHTYDSQYKVDDSFTNGATRKVKNGKISYVTYTEAENGKVTKSGDIKPSSDNRDTITTFGNSDSVSNLLKRTNELFREGHIKSLINRFHTEDVEGDELTTSYTSGVGISRGRNLLKDNERDTSTGYDDPYCRVWTKVKQYSKYSHAIRHTGPESYSKKLGDALRPNPSWTSYSALDDNGLPHIAPNTSEYTMDNIQRYMFSIENLAWRDLRLDKLLSTEQIGPNGGRIMWFPPYNLKFNENVTPHWNENEFIGRGEKIYTYTNTERNGNLSFTLLIDHPSSINQWRGPGKPDDKDEAQQILLRYFAGCGDLEPSNDKTTKDEKANNEEGGYDVTPSYEGEPIDVSYAIFFPNDFSCYDYTDIEQALLELKQYECGKKNIVTIRDEKFKNEVLASYNSADTQDYSLNVDEKAYSTQIINSLFGGKVDEDSVKRLNDLENISDEYSSENGRATLFGVDSQNYEITSIEIQGFASSHGTANKNQELCRRRSAFMKKIIKEYASDFVTNDMIQEKDGKVISVGQIDGKDVISSLDAKIARSAIAIFHLNLKKDYKPESETTEGGTTNVNGADLTESAKTEEETSGYTEPTAVYKVTSEGVYTYDNEYLYFQKIKDENYTVYQNIVDRISYFDPAFHSITPEGFNARLTFLHQCTRQGPTKSLNGGSNAYRDAKVASEAGTYTVEEAKNANIESSYLGTAGNLAFGRAPYCVLRIGDFYNTKICIDSLQIDYDNNGIQWDLNPEGVGIQPMMANINIGFHFVGGQDLSGPIARLQNAVTSNFYSNASVYNRYADTSGKTFNAYKGITTQKK